jgi:stage II sporulation protein D
MRDKFLFHKAIILIICLLFCSPCAKAQTDTQQTRPRRVTPDAAPPVQANNSQTNTGREPFVRVGLTTDARSATISADATLIATNDASGVDGALLSVRRVRIETGGILNSDVTRDEARNSNVNRSANLPRPVAGSNSNNETASSNIRLTARTFPLSTRELIVRSAEINATRTAPALLLRERDAIRFSSSSNETNSFVQLNGRAYRGSLEVFANRRGSLTVVNVVRMEDYLRGVVPNELSPGGYPEIEALKAQSIAARTYAMRNQGGFAAEGFDVLPTVRSQVYGGRSTEHPLTNRAVEETRGVVATYNSAPINALYTSTCGGRTEDGERIFGGNNTVPYLRARECAIEARLQTGAIRSSREIANLRDAEHMGSARAAALLSVFGFNIPARVTDSWLSAHMTIDDARMILSRISQLASRQTSPFDLSNDSTRPAQFCAALAFALDGESRARALMNTADVDYYLSFRDANDVPSAFRADVAGFIRDGHLTLYPDATLRPREQLSRARALNLIARVLEVRGLLRLQGAAARAATSNSLTVRGTARGADETFAVAPDVFLFRYFGEQSFPTRELNLIGGERVAFHRNAQGLIDYLEARPSASGASADRFSPYTHWTVTLSAQETAGRLASAIREANAGALLDLRIVSRGASGRVLDLEIVGTTGTAHVRGGRVRTALGLREQLFVIDRVRDSAGRAVSFTFTGRGWGHGVGMCQVGAYGMARAGLRHDQILRAYYTGIELTRLY